MINSVEERWRIGGITVLVRIPSGVMPVDWTDHFRTFALSSGSRERVDVTIDTDPIPGWFNTREVAPGNPVWTSTYTPSGTQLDGPDYTGELRLRKNSYEGTFTVDSTGSYGITGLMRGILAKIAADRGMLFLHASGVVRRGQLWLFSGPAHSGKTTIALELAGGGEPFCVDRAVLACPVDDVRAYPTPISDWNCITRNLPPLAPSGIAFIEQAEDNSIGRLSPALAACRLLQQIPYNTGVDLSSRPLLETAGRIAELTPCYKLRFKRDEQFWYLLDKRVEDKNTRE